MKLPSLQTLWNGFRNVLVRFPIQSIIVLLAGGLWLGITYAPEKADQEWADKIIILCNLAFTLSLSANLFSEINHYSRPKSLIIQLAALVPATILFFILEPFRFTTDSIRVALSLLAGHLLVSFSIWSPRLSVSQFWHFNKTIFLRFLTGVLFSMILYAGISVALLSIQTLFDYRFNGNIFFRLFIIVSVGFNSIFFLAGVPGLPGGDSRIPPPETIYPKILKIFTQYVLIPLLTIYFGILIVYELKIALSFQLPKGTVSYLVLGYSGFGILSYLLIYPLKDGEGNEWIRYFSKLFFWLMVPLLILLFIAIGVRVSDYGLTEKRYLIIALALWLSTISLYFSLSRSPRLVLIPITLFITLVLSVVGPQSATNLSRISQQTRLGKLLKSSDTDSLTQKESVVRYLTDFHGLESLQPYTERNLSEIQRDIQGAGMRELSRWQRKQQLRDSAFHLFNVKAKEHYSPMVHVSSQNKLIDSEGFRFVYWLEQSQDEEIMLGSGTIRIIRHQSQLLLTFPDQDTLKFDLAQLTSQMQKKYNDPVNKNRFARQEDNNYSVPGAWMTLKENSDRHVAELHVQYFSFSAADSTQKENLHSARGFLLIK